MEAHHYLLAFLIVTLVAYCDKKGAKKNETALLNDTRSIKTKQNQTTVNITKIKENIIEKEEVEDFDEEYDEEVEDFDEEYDEEYDEEFEESVFNMSLPEIIDVLNDTDNDEKTLAYQLVFGKVYILEDIKYKSVDSIYGGQLLQALQTNNNTLEGLTHLIPLNFLTPINTIEANYSSLYTPTELTMCIIENRSRSYEYDIYELLNMTEYRLKKCKDDYLDKLLLIYADSIIPSIQNEIILYPSIVDTYDDPGFHILTEHYTPFLFRDSEMFQLANSGIDYNAAIMQSINELNYITSLDPINQAKLQYHLNNTDEAIRILKEEAENDDGEAAFLLGCMLGDVDSKQIWFNYSCSLNYTMGCYYYMLQGFIECKDVKNFTDNNLYEGLYEDFSNLYIGSMCGATYDVNMTQLIESILKVIRIQSLEQYEDSFQHYLAGSNASFFQFIELGNKGLAEGYHSAASLLHTLQELKCVKPHCEMILYFWAHMLGEKYSGNELGDYFFYEATNYTVAFKFYSDAMERGSLQGSYNTAYMYEYGFGVNKSVEIAKLMYWNLTKEQETESIIAGFLRYVFLSAKCLIKMC